uniref:L-Ala-D/L-amino acid epimerase isoform X2 n=1 Tax=Tanacetum cinerariifolium TaxID=118510 RepID=A0A699I420_TANCI|nr:L-Ala-D/L-amino acid epimerase isoform X2 [Tanacetum cinerariifolium]
MTTATTKPSMGGFKTLMESFSVDIHNAQGRPLNVPLLAPFTIATSRFDNVENVTIRVKLSSGCYGWHESPMLPFVTAEDQEMVLVESGQVCEVLKKCGGMSLGNVLRHVRQLLPGHDLDFRDTYNRHVLTECQDGDCRYHSNDKDVKRNLEKHGHEQCIIVKIHQSLLIQLKTMTVGKSQRTWTQIEQYTQCMHQTLPQTLLERWKQL